MSRTLTASLLLVAAAMSACASAGDRLEEGLELEARGELYAASLRYIDALDKDATLESARVRLREAGSRALDRGLSDAEGGSAPIEAGREVLSLDALVDLATEVGVRLTLPDRYAERGDGLRDEASDALDELARDAERRGDWGEARDAYREIRLEMATGADRVRQAEESEARVLASWAEDDLRSDRYRSAYDRAAEALALASTPSVSGTAREIQARAVEAGTVFVVVMPTRLSPAVPSGGPIAPEFTRALDDALELDHWAEAPLFVSVVPPAETRRALRTAGATDAVIEGPGLRLLLSDLDAQVVALVEVTEFEADKNGVDQDVVEIPLEGGGTATTRLETGRLRYTVSADVEVVDERGNRLRRSSVSASASDRYELGIYEGDVRALRLSRRQREHFDPDLIAAQRLEIQERAAVELARDVASRIFSGALEAVR